MTALISPVVDGTCSRCASAPQESVNTGGWLQKLFQRQKNFDMSTTVAADGIAYILNQVFHFPTNRGSALAIAMSAADASSILSVYSILVNTAVGQIWAIIIIIGVYATLRQPPESRSHNAVVASVGILNAKRPLDVSTLSVNYLWKLKRKSPWMVLLWLFVSVFALIASAGVPALIGRRMVLGHGAPVRPELIYVPDVRFSNTTDKSLPIKINTLNVPSALRAAGIVQMNLGRLYESNVRMESPTVLQNFGNGESINRYNYHYRVTAKDLGLQRYNNLTLYVEGSCVTEYGWNTNSSNINLYHLWNNTTMTCDTANKQFMSPGPVAFFLANRTASAYSWTNPNTSFAILVSAVGRQSSSEGKDPMYLTEPFGSGHRVKDGRPALSCWQMDTWQYLSQNHSVTKLRASNSSLVNFPEILQSILVSSFAIPMIVNVGQRLGASALFSATRSTIGSTFDAGGASIFADLNYLVFASYFATKNTLLDTTLYSWNDITEFGIPNLVQEKDLKDVAAFVLYSKDISALSLTVLISVPVVVVILFLVAYLVTTHSWFPWHVVQGYQATILYSLLDERAHTTESMTSDEPDGREDIEKRIWKRGTIAWSDGPHKPGRHASIVTDADGKLTLALVGRREISLPKEAKVDRSVDQLQSPCFELFMKSRQAELTSYRNSDTPLLEVNLDFTSFSEYYDETQTGKSFETDTGHEPR